MFGNYTDFNPLFGTDYGICSCIKPQIAFNKSLTHVPYWEKVNSVRQRPYRVLKRNAARKREGN